MKRFEELKEIFPALSFDVEEFEESLQYADFLNSKQRCDLNYDLAQHRLYQAVGSGEVIDRRRIHSVPEAFEPTLSPSETHWQFSTSGTSGVPLQIMQSSRAYFHNLFETIPRSLAVRGVTLPTQESLLHIFFTDNPSHWPCVHLDPRQPSTAFLTIVLRSDEEWTNTIDLMVRLRPHTISSKPNLFRMMLEHDGVNRLASQGTLKALISSGSAMPEDTRQLLESKFSAPVVNSYNTSEAGHMGAACAAGKIHLATLHNDFLVQCEGELFADGEGDLVVSTNLNDCMPMRNYLVGDRVELLRDGCACGKSGPFLNRFEGRSVPHFVLPSGRTFSPTRWMRLLQTFPAIREFQITQKQNLTLDVQVDVEGDLKQLQENLRVFLNDGLTETLNMNFTAATFSPGAKLQRFRREAI